MKHFLLTLGLLGAGCWGIEAAAQVSDPTIGSPASYHSQVKLAPPAAGAARTSAAWTAVASMSTARAQQGTVAHPNGNIYVFGGYTGSVTYSSTEAYNIATNTWSSRAAMPVAMQGMAAAVGNDGNIYSFAGRDMNSYRSECFRYNPTTDTWTSIATMPSPRWEARALTAANGLIYVFGGWNFDLGVMPGNEVQIYNPATNTWTLGAPIPAPVMGMAAAVDAAGLMHIYGGIGSNPYPPLTSHYIYNTATNTWTTGPSMPAPARGYTSGTTGSDGNLYIAGGDSDIAMNNGTFYNNVDSFSPGTNTWSASTPLPLALTEMRAVTAGSYVYVVGGLAAVNTPQTAMYRMATGVATATATTWTGNVSTDWFVAGNWTDGVPTASLDATIPSGRPNMPSVGTGTATAKSLTINSSATVTLSGGTLDLKGDFINNGTFTPGTSGVTLSGTAAQTVGGTSTSRLYDLTVGTAGATLGGPVQLQHLLTLNGNLASGGQLTLLSTPALSAMVVNGAGQLQGSLTAQRAASGTAQGYRHYSPPVVGATVAQLGTGGSAIVVNPAYNTAANPGQVNQFPTVFAYDETRLSNPTTASFDGGWNSPASLTDVLPLGKALTVQSGGSQTVSFTGTAATAPVTVANLGNSGNADAGWHLLGNPFLAPLNLAAMRTGLQTGGLADAVYVYRPSGPYTGSYDQYVNNIGTGGLAAGQLAVGQGFFVRNLAPGTTASLAFTAAMRASTYANPAFQRGTAETRPRLDLQVANASTNDVVVFYADNGATTGADAHFDAWKIPTATPLRIATLAGAEQLSIQGLPTALNNVVLPLTVSAAQAGPATFSAAQVLNFSPTATLELEDRLTGTLHNLRTGSYTAQLSAGANDGRFFVHLTDARVTATASSLSAQLQLYPNPAQGRAYLSLPATGSVRISVLNSVGQLVHTRSVPASNGLATAELNTAALPAGIYYVQAATATEVANVKLVVQ